MANNPITVPLPQDLPETWAVNQIVSPDGVSAGLTPQHGYNYLMKQVNNAQQAAQELGEGIAGLSGDNLPASSDGGETISSALSNKVTVNAGVISDTMDNAIQPGRWTVSVPGSASGNPPDFQSASTLFGFLDVYTQGSPSWIMQIFSPADDANYIGYVYVRKNINSAGWTSWYRFATATPPQEYDLPLAEGVSGAIKYSKDQMGVVRLLGQVELATNQSGIIGIGTLPEGFYLEYAVATVCCGWPDGGANIAPCTAVVNADGVVAINAFDASLKVFAVNVSFGG
mgnify:CR=1 FL=1